MSDESILTVPRSALFDGHWPQGFVPLEPGAIDDTIARFEAQGRFEPRGPAEEDPSRKQPIPYCAVLRGREIFVTRRLKKQGEARLHGKSSVGLGGHVDLEDGPVLGSILRALERELREELLLDEAATAAIDSAELFGLINDDTTSVGRVHVGFAFLLQVPETSEVRVAETEKMEGGFTPLVDARGLWLNLPDPESWSRLLLDHLRTRTNPYGTHG